VCVLWCHPRIWYVSSGSIIVSERWCKGDEKIL